MSRIRIGPTSSRDRGTSLSPTTNTKTTNNPGAAGARNMPGPSMPIHCTKNVPAMIAAWGAAQKKADTQPRRRVGMRSGSTAPVAAKAALNATRATHHQRQQPEPNGAKLMSRVPRIPVAEPPRMKERRCPNREVERSDRRPKIGLAKRAQAAPRPATSERRAALLVGSMAPGRSASVTEAGVIIAIHSPSWPRTYLGMNRCAYLLPRQMDHSVRNRIVSADACGRQ